MKRWALAAAGALAGLPHAAQAQFSGATYGAYNSNPLNLSAGAFAPLQLDQTGNLKIDCIVGCSSASASSTSSQGSPATIGNAWPIYQTQGGAAISAGNPLFIQDPLDGAPISGTSLPSGGSGILGWLSAMYRLQAGTLTVGGTVAVSGNVAVTDSTVAAALAKPLSVVTGGISGAPTVSTGSVSGTTTVLAAEPSNTNRLHMTVVNFAGAGGTNLYCTDDGSTPSSTNASFIVYAQGFYERDAPAWVPAAAIACVSGTGSVAYRAESYP